MYLSIITLFFIYFQRFYLFTSREKRMEVEKEGEKHDQLPFAHPQLRTWPATQACALIGN